jgi:hypothetical protein
VFLLTGCHIIRPPPTTGPLLWECSSRGAELAKSELDRLAAVRGELERGFTEDATGRERDTC